MGCDAAKIAEVLKAAKSPMKGKSKPYTPSDKQIWRLMKEGATRHQIMLAGKKGAAAFNSFFTDQVKTATKWKTAHDMNDPCPGTVLAVLAAAGATPEEYAEVKDMSATAAYEALDEYLPNGCPAYVAEGLMGKFEWAYEDVKDLDEETAKAALRTCEEEEEAAAEAAAKAKAKEKQVAGVNTPSKGRANRGRPGNAAA